MKRSKFLVAIFLGSLAASLGAAQTEEWPSSAPRGVDRASAAAKPNEAGALPESSPQAARNTPDGTQEERYGSAETAPPSAQDPAEQAAAAPDSSAGVEERELPATASPLAHLTVSALLALAAGGGLYRLRREQQ